MSSIGTHDLVILAINVKLVENILERIRIYSLPHITSLYVKNAKYAKLCVVILDTFRILRSSLHTFASNPYSLEYSDSSI